MASRLKTVYEYLVIILAGCICIATGFLLYYQFDGVMYNIPVEFNDPHHYDHPVRPHIERPQMGITHLTTKHSYLPGEMVYAYIDVVKNVNVSGIIQWQLMDQRFYPYVSRRGVLPKGHIHQVVPVEKIPLHVPPGQYHFSGTVVYEMNWLRSITVPIRTNCFMVEENAEE